VLKRDIAPSQALRLIGYSGAEMARIVCSGCDKQMKFLADKAKVGGLGLAFARKSKPR